MKTWLVWMYRPSTRCLLATWMAGTAGASQICLSLSLSKSLSHHLIYAHSQVRLPYSQAVSGNQSYQFTPDCKVSCDLASEVREGGGTPLQYSCLENPMDRGAWEAAVHGVSKSQTRLSDFTFTFHSHALEKEMATPTSVLSWRNPGTGEPGGLPSLGSHRVGHDWSGLAAAEAAAASEVMQTQFQWIVLAT